MISTQNVMGIVYTALVAISSLFGGREVKTRPEKMPMNENTGGKSIYDFTLTTLDGEQMSLATFKGKKMLIVNTASACGYTPQYAELQQLHEQHGDKVAVLGFPANNFGGQEPGSNQQIAAFCKKNYGVTFQMFAKISVIGSDQHPLYRWLTTKEENGWNEKAPNWNFCKYLVSEKGELLKFYSSSIKPLSDDIVTLL